MRADDDVMRVEDDMSNGGGKARGRPAARHGSGPMGDRVSFFSGGCISLECWRRGVSYHLVVGDLRYACTVVELRVPSDDTQGNDAIHAKFHCCCSK